MSSYPLTDLREGPLVSILIPTYNRPRFFEQALKSALNQSYPNIEILVGDDSTNNETEQLMERYLKQHSNIRYYKNEENMGQFLNDIKLFDLSNGDYINYLMDDDLFYPQKIEKMIRWFLDDPKEQIKVVTSHRQLIDEEGSALPDWPATRRFYTEDTVEEGITIGNIVVGNSFNCIGEPTTVLFRKKDLKEPFGMFAGRTYGCNVDVATWMNLLSDGKLVYISETLSCFRSHNEQQQNNPVQKIQGAADYAHSILNAPSKGFLQNQTEYRDAIRYCLQYVDSILRIYSSEISDHPALEEAKAFFISLKSIKKELDPCFCVYCQESFENFENHSHCPVCQSSDHERLLRLYLENNTRLDTPLHLLHDSPEPKMKEWLQGYDNITYIAGRLNPQKYEAKLDLMHLTYPDHTFDAVICSHPLPKSPLDLQAMKELHRVLKYNGWALLQDSETDSTPFTQRLESVGFDVKLTSCNNILDSSGVKRNGLTPDALIYKVTKKLRSSQSRIISVNEPKLVFAILAHDHVDVLAAQIDNVRRYNPWAQIVLYNGGTDPTFGLNQGIPVCPYSRRLHYGNLTRYFYDTARWLEEERVDYDYLINLDNDVLFVKKGFGQFIHDVMDGYDVMGAHMQIQRSPYDYPGFVPGLTMWNEWHRWQPSFGIHFFARFFNPGQVYTRQIIRTILSYNEFPSLEHLWTHNGVAALEEMFWVTFALSLGAKCREYPWDFDESIQYVRHISQISEKEMLLSREATSYYWIHPVKNEALKQMNLLMKQSDEGK